MYKGAGVIFMGGKASRLGGVKKPDIQIGAETCFERAQARLGAQLDVVAVSVATPTNHSLPTLLDWPSGPNDGGVIFSVLAVLKWASANYIDYVVTAPCDTPFLPPDYAARLIDKYNGTAPVVCASAGRVHNLHALWPAAQFENLKSHVLNDGERKVGRIHDLISSEHIEFEVDHIDPFFNINTPEDLKQARAYAEELSL